MQAESEQKTLFCPWRTAQQLFIFFFREYDFPLIFRIETPLLPGVR